MVDKCYVPGCKTGYKSEKRKRRREGRKNLSLFRVPQDEDQRKKWNKAVPRLDRTMQSQDRVCELHFLPEEISREFIHNMPDGNVVTIKRERAVLMSGAVPTIFPSLPSYFNKNKRKRKPPVERIPLPPKKAKNNSINLEKINTVNEKCNTQLEETDTVDENNTQPEEINIVDVKVLPEFTFNDLLRNLSRVSKPHKLWAVSSHEDFIVCVKWNVSFGPEFKCQPERQVIVDANLDIRNMYYGTEVSIRPNIAIESVESLSLILKEVNRYEVCPGAMKKNANCSIYKKRIFGPYGRSYGRPQKYCDECKGNISKQYLTENDSSDSFKL